MLIETCVKGREDELKIFQLYGRRCCYLVAFLYMLGHPIINSYEDFTCFLALEICSNNVRIFSQNSLRSATGNFHPSNRIGRGGFGVVYRGVLRDGTQVAVKCLSAESKQGTHQFLTEIRTISSIQHPNLVQLIGCCVEDNNRILVYEYLENNSLATALMGNKRILKSHSSCSYDALSFSLSLTHSLSHIHITVCLCFCFISSFRVS
uniref:Protein kinase domain-containing protein n=1 Tax=Rhizophora mucronata TaxID=61149 RepID=A0A2P2JJQ4_RHIMU